jgi:acetylornithine/N-succinyldiaminopimelate aminotransferase
MLTHRQIFLEHLAQTSREPLLLEIESAKGAVLYGPGGKEYLDLISGISVSNVGHCHPAVVTAVQEQCARYMHVMVYGELVQSPQTLLALALTRVLPPSLNSCYFVNSGSEAIEGAMKLAKRVTGRTEIISFRNAYHGSTQGALSIMGDEYFKNAFRPLLPDTRILDFGDAGQLTEITSRTACVVAEAIQGEAGAVMPPKGYLEALSARCRETGTLLVLDEIQTGFRRTGPLMAFMDTGIVPDILVLAKGMGGGMPIGAFIAARELTSVFTDNPVLGHITTFGGHPVSCAAALATLKITESIPAAEVEEKGRMFRERLVHPLIKNISGKGLLLAIEFESEALNREVITRCIAKGVFTDWFLFAPHKMRLAPPLVIEHHQIFMACDVILEVLNELRK